MAIGGTIIVLARTFLKDKHVYLTDLTSAAATRIGASVEQQLNELSKRLDTFDGILKSFEKIEGSQELLQSSFRNLDNAIRLEVYDPEGLVAGLGVPNHPLGTSHLMTNLEKELPDHSTLHPHKGAALFSTWIGKRFYLILLDPNYFASSLEIVLASFSPDYSEYSLCSWAKYVY